MSASIVNKVAIPAREAKALRDLLVARGEVETARLVGASRASCLRAAAGLPLRRAVRELVQRGLASLGDEAAQ